MKKAFAVLLALVLSLSLSVVSFAVDNDAAVDFAKIVEELLATVSPEDLAAALQEALDGVVPEDFDLEGDDLAAVLSDEDVNEVSDSLIDSLNLGGTDIATQIQEAMSGDFVSFLAGLYTGPGEETTTAEATTTTKKEEKPVTTGSSNTIALAAFAVLAVMGGAAVVLKKKED